MGHVFIVRGDITQVACDAWLIPTDAELTLSGNWRAHVYEHLHAVPKSWADGQRPAMPLEGWPKERPQPWVVETGVTEPEHDIDWLVGNVVAFVEAFAVSSSNRFLTSRERPLVALPLVGTGQGGFEEKAGRVLPRLLRALRERAAAHRVDVALVLWDDASYAAAQAERERLEGAFVELSDELRVVGDELAAFAQARKLVPFIGAGLSVGAGLPNWTDLLSQLAERAHLSESVRSALGNRDPLDQAEILSRKLGDTLGEHVASIVGGDRPYSLGHGLLASLPITEAVTTNYDALFERASRAATHEPIDVLPYSPSTEPNRWVLKMHGCVSEKRDIVLSRESFLRYDETRGALKGLVQGLLMTKHMLFVGFSLHDPNFHHIADEVRRAVRPRGESESGSHAFGTALALFPDPLAQLLWSEIRWTAVAGEKGQEAVGARRVELLLDYVGSRAAAASHLLVERFHPTLSEAELELRERLLPLLGLSEAARRTPAGQWIWRLLGDLGAPRGETD